MMAVSSSLQLSHEMGFFKNRGDSRFFKSINGRGKIHVLSTRLSSHSSRQDSWSIRHLDSVYSKTQFLPHRSNVSRCCAFLLPGQALRIPIAKNVSMALTRSFDSFQGSPLVLKLVPAAGIIIFAVWGLAPLMRHSRNLILRKSDNSWKKSGTHHVMTSYLQPLLLWTGITLICRALDPIVLASEASHAVKLRLVTFVRSLSTVLAFAYCLSSVIQEAQKFWMETNDATDTRSMGFQFAGKAVYSAVWVAAVSLFMELLGFSTQRWLTAGGLGTVLLTLAGREIFTNFLSSAMIHVTRPFVVNEWIQTKIEGYEVSGTVEHVGWWSPTIVRGEDREAVHIPNHKFTVNVVRNLTQKTHWRIKTHLAISHLDVNKINNIVADMRKVLAKNPQVEQQRLHRRVFLENINPENQALLILISCFVKTSHFEEYLCVKEAILLDLLRVISHHRARLATPIRTVQKIYSDADLDNIPFADRSGVASKRPFLLIEPPYKISGEDRTKSQSRSVRSNTDQDSKASTRPTANTAKVDAKSGATENSDSKKADAKVGELPNSDLKEDHKVESAPISEAEVGDKAVVNSTSKTISNTDYKAAEISSSDPKTPISWSNDLAQKAHEDKKSKKAGSDSIRQTSKNDQSETSCVKSGSFSATPQGKQGDRLQGPLPTPRPVLEENIVLGVALEGSKRTLPIEEEMGPRPNPADETELATCRNGSGASSVDKDRKDNQTSASQSASDD